MIPAIASVPMSKAYVDRIESWPSPCPEDEGVTLLASTLHSIERRFSNIGFEIGRESVLRMSILDFLRLKDLLPSVSVVDASPALWATRNIKSDLEIAKIRTAATIAGLAFEAVPGYARSGMTEESICREFTIDLLRGGAHEVPYLASASGPGGYDQIISRGTQRALRDGDIFIMDVGATVDGYFCDFDRNYAVGDLSDSAKRANEAVWNATQAGIESARSGTRVSDLWSSMMTVLQAAGMKGNNVGRMGHGLGLQLTEPPSNSSTDEAVLEPGMVITIEPGMEYEKDCMIVHEENIYITPDGYAELLTPRAPKEMWRLDPN
ncbi:hypothetical protein PPUN110474_27830 [Pseudomonas putida]|nr:hypothetical protein PPUN110474_27830 [Pseudomonas putida]